MDLSKTLEEVQLKDKQDEIMVRDLLELSAKKYNLQKELEGLKMKFSMKKSVLKRLEKEVTILSLEVPVLKRHEEIIKHTVQDLLRDVVLKSKETDTIQEHFWAKINGFVSDSNRFLAKKDSWMKNKNNSQIGLTSAERQNKIRQLKLESELEAMHLYEKYQTTKMMELKVIKDLLGKNSFAI